MSEFAWLGVLVSASVSTLALASWFVMAVPYFDNAPYLAELKQHTGLAYLIGTGVFILFFAVFYLAALYLDEKTSGPLLAFSALVVLLPFSMLLGSETWDRYNPRGMNKVPGLQAVAVATGIGLSEVAGLILVFMLLFHIG